jgi:hypothetical protein
MDGVINKEEDLTMVGIILLVVVRVVGLHNTPVSLMFSMLVAKVLS